MRLTILFIVVLVLLLLFLLRPHQSDNFRPDYVPPRLVPAFLSPGLCSRLRSKALQKGMNLSEVKDYKPESAFRNSFTCWLAPDDPDVRLVFNKISRLTATDPSSYESLQVVRYFPGHFFHAHHDQCDPKEPYCQRELDRFHHRPRVYTVLIYLSDPSDYDDGSTEFPRLGLAFKGKKGDALWFHNLDTRRSRVHPDSFHRANPVTRGEKWICNVWIRSHTFSTR